MSRDANPPLKRQDFVAVLYETIYFSSNFIEMNLQRKQKTQVLYHSSLLQEKYVFIQGCLEKKAKQKFKGKYVYIAHR